MPSKPQDITSYVFTATDRLLLDTNVWLFVHGPTSPADKRVAIYSNALARILAAKSMIHIDVLVLSEFINRYARLGHRILISTFGAPDNFKQFRSSADFKPLAQDIADAVRRILKDCSRTESGFASVDITSLIDEHEKGESDFNDQMLTELCKSQGLSFVTHDGDFKGSTIPIVTANTKLLVLSS